MKKQNKEKFFLKAKKSLGQHFLRSEKALNTMVDSIVNTHPRGCVVFEIGPGEGVLTEKLLEKGFTVYTIEIDRRSIELLKEKFGNEIKNKKLFIIEKNCLEVNYTEVIKKQKREYTNEVSDGGFYLVGNIPYYITGAIFRHTFEQKVLPKQAMFLIQKEVAQRIVANDKKESLLSISIKIFGQTKILDIVKAGSFVPPPKVDSAIISINNISSPFRKGGMHQEIFFKILRAGFSHKRKLFLSNLKTDLEENLYEKYFEKIKSFVPEKVRPEDISLETWFKIIKFIEI